MRTHSKIVYTVCGTAFGLNAIGCGEPQKPISKPNVIFILADDLGYGDLSAYNPQGKIKTPVLDSLATAGVRFTNAHSSAAVSTPTRYGLMTGRYPWRSDLKCGVLWTWADPLLSNELTLPQMMKDNGYTTALIGKWHLGIGFPTKDGAPVDKANNGSNVDYTKAISDGPTHHGFDFYYGDDVPNFPPYVFIENDRFTEIPDREFPKSGVPGVPGIMSESWRAENLLPTQTSKSVDYIKSNRDKPFFLMVSLTAPHTPIAPNKEFIGKSEAGRYGDFVQEMDYRIGCILAAVKEAGLSDKTIIVFSSDNGSSFQDGGCDNGEKYAGKFGSILKYGHNPSGEFKGMKSDSWEGGHRVPFIVSIPEGAMDGDIKNNIKSDELVCDLDIFATLADMLNYTLPHDEAMDSRSLLPLLRGAQPTRQNLIVQSGNGILSYISGDWKLIAGSGCGGSLNPFAERGELPTMDSVTGQWTNIQLYDMAGDSHEVNNLASERPDVVEQLMNDIAAQIRNRKELNVWHEIMWIDKLQKTNN